MKRIPITSESPLLRTDFSDGAAWESVCEAIRRPSAEGFVAYVELIDDPAFDGASKEQLLAAVPVGYPHSFLLVVDRATIVEAEHPVLVINLSGDLGSEVGDDFRAVPAAVQGIQNNLAIANMDFAEFADAVDERGVFRGF